MCISPLITAKRSQQWQVALQQSERPYCRIAALVLLHTSSPPSQILAFVLPFVHQKGSPTMPEFLPTNLPAL